jgi:hypothetical protein
MAIWCALWWIRGGGAGELKGGAAARPAASCGPLGGPDRWLRERAAVVVTQHMVRGQPARCDPLLEPVAITEHCVIGDQIRGTRGLV